ncbi:tRNA (adenosine(37)-N6)-threonylcarbamoyltransferase complex ATPase subunit type 1 TsaE [Tamlana fucoidanivorans]|uniref:tRNA threonylcarbamoyladenosine biosynthesis protein TsaE n=1 Tax=Allotamlana fucoidanivorans TaxID=2583814 RepID=A0A5C4SQG1_9FLAO|nr:tRNA (adenosine(37)-N6)-threonylcarbamoyltransferase complex ATPase subunit type 1 TsaE [Tamlana fucoidanivorans]TNJ46444.1 tRNA (adenosine(37)-N6)-threonylcarbamoyltransferase complex ATPase subunit type 1 TsaE [Tamlana fucoidanivorans]
MEIRYNLNDIQNVANQIIKNAKHNVLLFYGEMGVGKTTLIREIVKALGSNDDVSSPTFSIVNEYQIDDGVLYHFDLYRVKDLDEAYNFGIEDYLNSDAWILIEWPELIEPILDKNIEHIEIKLLDNKTRKLVVKQRV